MSCIGHKGEKDALASSKTLLREMGNFGFVLYHMYMAAKNTVTASTSWVVRRAGCLTHREVLYLPCKCQLSGEGKQHSGNGIEMILTPWSSERISGVPIL